MDKRRFLRKLERHRLQPAFFSPADQVRRKHLEVKSRC